MRIATLLSVCATDALVACACNTPLPVMPPSAHIEEPNKPTPVVSPVRPENPADIVVELQANETISWVAQTLGVAVDRVRQANPGLSDRPGAGTKLYVRATQTSVERLQAERDHLRLVREARDLKHRKHVGNERVKVRSGDNWPRIWKRYGEPPRWLAERLNPGFDFERLRAGDAFVMPVLVKAGENHSPVGQFFLENRAAHKGLAGKGVQPNRKGKHAAGPSNAKAPQKR